jgi:hypothetical protein
MLAQENTTLHPIDVAWHGWLNLLVAGLVVSQVADGAVLVAGRGQLSVLCWRGAECRACCAHAAAARAVGQLQMVPQGTIPLQTCDMMVPSFDLLVEGLLLIDWEPMDHCVRNEQFALAHSEVELISCIGLRGDICMPELLHMTVATAHEGQMLLQTSPLAYITACTCPHAI